MDTIKKNWIPLAISTGVALGLAIVYFRLTKKSQVELQVDNSDYIAFIDQRSSQEYKNQQGLSWLKSIISKQILIDGNSLKCGEDGLLKREDLSKIMKILEIMAKVSLYETRITHQEERLSLLLDNNYKGYVTKVITDQLEKEIRIFDDVMSQVFSLSKVNKNLYNESSVKYTNEKDSILEALQNSLLSPFISQRGYGEQEAKNMFQFCTKAALDKISSKEIVEEIAQKDEILIIFDALMVDYALQNYNISGDEFKATLSKYNIGWDSSMKQQIQSVVDKLFNLNEQFDQQIEGAQQ